MEYACHKIFGYHQKYGEPKAENLQSAELIHDHNITLW